MIQQQATSFAEEYIVDVSADLVNEILLLKAIHTDNFGKDVLPPHDLAEPFGCRKFRWPSALSRYKSNRNNHV